MAGTHSARDLSDESLAEEKFRLAVESCPSCMVMSDGTGTIVLVNAEAERLFGYERDELIGRPMEMLVPEGLRSGYFERRSALARRPQPQHFRESANLFGRRRDGSEFPAEVRLNPIRSREGLLVLAVIVDISEQKRIERLKDEFVSTVSHELRTPLTSIAGSLGLLIGGAGGELSGAAFRLISIAQSNSQKLVRLINDILDIEKIESGQMAFNFKRLSARSLAEQAIEDNRGYADGFHVRLRLDADPIAGEVYADQDRLAQVITNLLSNAIKFSPENGEVTVSVHERDGAVRIGVRDHGSGIPREFRARIFEKFAQADTAERRQKGGTGLGLSIVRRIVTRLGGKVDFDDALGGGTIFRVDLPSWAQIAARAIDPERSAHVLRILLCAGDPDAALALRESLRTAGYSLDFAYTPADATTRIEADRYAAVLCDLDLPDGAGVGLMRALRQLPKTRDMPIVAMSVDCDQYKDGFSSADPGIIEWLQRPVDTKRLVQTLDRVVARDAGSQPRILHVDDDHDVLDIVAQTLEPIAKIVSVDTVDEARYVLAVRHFDLVILDITVGAVSGLDLIPDLRRAEPLIPVIIFSAHPADLRGNPQVEASLNKSSSSALTNLVGAVHDRLMLRTAPSAKGTA